MPTEKPVAPIREKAEIVDGEGLRRAITRIAHEIIERNDGAKNLVLVTSARAAFPWPSGSPKRSASSRASSRPSARSTSPSTATISR